jgi:hypothetical protein
MTNAQTHHPYLEVSGHYLAGLDSAPLPATVARLRQNYHLHQINCNTWYPADMVLGFYEAVGADEAGFFDLVTIGRHMAETFSYPLHIHTVHDALETAPELHRDTWRGGFPGDFTVSHLDERHAQLVCKDLLLPVDLIYGLCYGLVERFAPDAEDINVQRITRGNRCIFDLRW